MIILKFLVMWKDPTDFLSILRRYVLTAAHCNQGSKPVAQIVLGENDLEQDPDCLGCDPVQTFDIKPSDVTVHENYNASNIFEGNDIALIRLPRLATTIDQSSR